MEISLDVVEEIAKLAKLELTPEQKKEMTCQLSRIITYIDKLNEVDTSAVPPTSHATGITCRLREDVIEPWLSQEEALANAPAKSKGYFSVPKVIK